ncbi:MAG TPA: SRPBCC family protein [Bacilli bacterium]|nr:SRPBCC family protein [Bacilli bacterium]
MKQVTAKMKIRKPAHDVFEAFVDPDKIGEFWFSSSSERWEQGKTITLRYEEYNATAVMKVLELVPDRKIVIAGTPMEEELTSTFELTELEDGSTLIEVTETGFREDETLVDRMLGQQAGWVYVLTCLKAYLEFGANLRGALVH